MVFFIYNLISIIFICLIFFFLKKNFTNVKTKKNNEYKLVFLIISLICLYFLIIDLINIINYIVENYPINRSLMYYDILNKRNTHINILILVATASFYENRLLSLFSYLSLITYNILSYSRIELIILISIIFCTLNIEKKYRNLIYLSFFLTAVLIVFYRFYLSSQNIIYVLMDPLHLVVNTFNFINNYEYTKFLLILSENFKFILNDFFYFNIYLDNPFLNDRLPTYSKRGLDTVMAYPLVFIIYLFTLVVLKNFFLITEYFFSSVLVFLIISLFRGNFVHNIGFIIKLYLLIIIFEWLVRKIKLWLSKEV